MAAYFIATYDIVDQEAYQAYVPGVIPLLQRYGVEILAADYDVRVLEGEGRQVNVVLRFPSEEAALSWYNDPEYQPLKRIRVESTTNASLVLAKEFVPPAG